MKFKITIAIALMFSAQILFGQTQNLYNFHGIVNADGMPKGNCTVKVSENGKVKFYSKTLSNGYFNVLLDYGKKFKIEFSHPDYAANILNLATTINQPSVKLRSNIYSVNLSKTPGKEAFYAINTSGKLSDSKPFSPDAGVTPEAEQLIADANDRRLRAELSADSIINAALQKQREMEVKIELEQKSRDSISRVAETNFMSLHNETVSEEVTESLSDESKKLLKAKDAEIEKILKKGNLTSEDSLSYIREVIQKKELLLNDVKDQLKKAEEAGDSVKVAELQQLIRKLEPELGIVKEQAARYEKELKLKDEEIRRRSQQLLMIVGIVILLFGLLFVLAVFTRQRKKHNNALKEKNTVLEEQKAEIRKQTESLIEANALISDKNNVLQNQNIQIAEQNEQIHKSITYAGTIQQAVLPMDTILEKHFEHFVIYNPKDVVSGDFYWFSELIEVPRPPDTEDMMMLAVADCTGHGVPGAFMSLISMQLLNQIVNEHHTADPAAVLEQLDAGIAKALKQEETGNTDGIDLSLVLIKRMKDGSVNLTFSNAKRPLTIYDYATREVKTIDGNRRSIGGSRRAKSKSAPFENQQITVNANDVIYLDSDGFGDQNNAQREKLGRVKLVEAYAKIGYMPLEKQKEKMIELLQNHKQSEEQRDDITLVGIRFAKA